MKNRAAIVTGGAQGIGKAITRRLLAAGARVLFADVDEEAGEEAAAEFARQGDALFFRADVSREDEVRLMVGEAVEHFGGLHLLVNNAGIVFQKPLAEMRLADWKRVLGTNLTGPFLCAQKAWPHLKAGRGSIVNIASTRALMSEPGTEAYSASKGGLVALTHSLAVDMGPEVRVNCVSPGWIEVSEWKKTGKRKKAELRPEDHAQHPAGRVGRPEDVAELVLFLASERAGFITGANYVIDGGMTRKMIYLE